jgi:hypothetical protein
VRSTPTEALRSETNKKAGPRVNKRASTKRDAVPRAVYTPEQDKFLVLRKSEGLPWQLIYEQFNAKFGQPWRNLGSLQVHYSTKLRAMSRDQITPDLFYAEDRSRTPSHADVLEPAAFTEGVAGYGGCDLFQELW